MIDWVPNFEKRKWGTKVDLFGMLWHMQGGATTCQMSVCVCVGGRPLDNVDQKKHIEIKER